MYKYQFSSFKIKAIHFFTTHELLAIAKSLQQFKWYSIKLSEQNYHTFWILCLFRGYPLICMHTLHIVNQACEEIKRLNKQLFDARQALESSEVHSRELKEENTLLRSRLVGLREQAAQLKRIWEEQSGELSRLRHHQTHRSTHVKQHTLASPQLATLERMGPTVKQARQRPRRSFSMGKHLCIS